MNPLYGFNGSDHFKEVELHESAQSEAEYNKDTRPHKINAGTEMILDPRIDEPFVPKTFQETSIAHLKPEHIIRSPEGYSDYLSLHGEHLVFGEDVWKAMGEQDEHGKPETMAWAQTMGGTHALHLAAKLLKRATTRKPARRLYIDQGWDNYRTIFRNFDIATYRHLHPESLEYDHESFMARLTKRPRGTYILLQVGAYNNDGADRTQEQWQETIDEIQKLELLPILDFAYNGLGRGIYDDNYPVRQIAEQGIPGMVCVSNSGNVGNDYRLGSFYFMNLDPDVAKRVQSTLTHEIIAPQNPRPAMPAAMKYAEVLEDETTREEYVLDIYDILKNVIIPNRAVLEKVLAGFVPVEGSGPYVLLRSSGLSYREQEALREKHAIHVQLSSRINVTSISPDDIEDVAHKIRKILLQ